MTAKDLKPFDCFKQKRQRKFRFVASTIVLPNRAGIPQKHVGKILIVDERCRQWIIDPDSEVILFNPFFQKTF